MGMLIFDAILWYFYFVHARAHESYSQLYFTSMSGSIRQTTFLLALDNELNLKEFNLYLNQQNNRTLFQRSRFDPQQRHTGALIRTRVLSGKTYCSPQALSPRENRDTSRSGGSQRDCVGDMDLVIGKENNPIAYIHVDQSVEHWTILSEVPGSNLSQQRHNIV